MNNYQHAIIGDTKVLGHVEVTVENDERIMQRPQYPDLELLLHHTYHAEFASHGVSQVRLVFEHVRNVKSILSKLLPGTIIEHAASNHERQAFVIRIAGKEIPVRCASIRATKYALQAAPTDPTA